MSSKKQEGALPHDYEQQLEVELPPNEAGTVDPAAATSQTSKITPSAGKSGSCADTTNPDLSDLYESLNISPAGRAYIERVRNGDPARRTRGGRGNVCIRYASHKMGHVVQCESRKAEFPYAVQCEFDDTVREYWDQPEQIKVSYLTAAGRKTSHYHTPDYLVIKDNEIVIIGCKTESELLTLSKNSPELFRRSADGLWSCPPAEAAAAELGLRYKVVSTNELSPILVRNCEFLKDYRIGEPDLISAAADSAITAFFEAHKYAKLKELLVAVGSADAVFQAILEGRFYFDIHHDLLARPEGAMVYAERVYANVLASCDQSTQGAETEVPEVSFEPGAAILWDEVRWQVFNATADRITLGGENGSLITLDKNQVDALLKDGRLQGIRIADNEKLRALLCASGPNDLKEALFKQSAIARALDGKGGSAEAVPGRTARHWRLKFKRAEVALGLGLAGLVRKKPPGNTKPRFSLRIQELVEKSIDEVYKTPAAPTLAAAYAVFVGWCRQEHFTPCSSKTYSKRVHSIQRDKLIRARQGANEAYQAAGPVPGNDTSLPTHGDRAFEIAHIDHTLIEIVVVSAVTGEELGRLWLTLMIDAYTRVVLAHYLTFDPPSYRSLMMVLRECVRRHGRLPDKIVVDGGKEFDSIYFEALLAFFGVSKISRPPRQPRFGSVVERPFRSIQEGLFHSLKGNTQNRALGRSASASHDPDKHAVWTADALDAEVGDWLYNVYPGLRHHGVHEAPRDRMQRSLEESGLRAHRRIAYNESFLILTMPAPSPSTRLIHPRRGVRLHHFDYWSPELGAVRAKGEKAEVRYDPFVPSLLYVYLRGQWIRCRTRNTLLQDFTERDVKFAAEEIRQLAALTGRAYRLTPQVLVDHILKLQEREAALEKERKALLARYHNEVPTGAVPQATADSNPEYEVHDEVQLDEVSYPITTLDEENV